MTKRITLPKPSSFKDLDSANRYIADLHRSLEQIEFLTPEDISTSSGGLTQEQIEDIMGGFIIAGEGITVNYSDGSNQLVITSEDEVPYDTLLDEDGSYTYVGKAAVGSSEASAVWRIFRLDESSSPDSELRYADGVSTFTKIWNNRATYTY
jgi:hypothetical protein